MPQLSLSFIPRGVTATYLEGMSQNSKHVLCELEKALYKHVPQVVTLIVRFSKEHINKCGKLTFGSVHVF